METKYLVQCKHCGRILFKTSDPFIRILVAEIKCPDCKRSLKMPEDIVLNLDKKARPGLETEG